MPEMILKRSTKGETQQKQQTSKIKIKPSSICKVSQIVRLKRPARSSFLLLFSMQIQHINFPLNTNFLKLQQHLEQLFLLLACICVYSPGLWAQDFVFDDQEAILNNPVVSGKKHWSEVFWTDYWGHPIHLASSHKSYRPVTTLTFILERALFGLRPFVHRLTNVLLHAIVTLQIYNFVAKISTMFGEKAKERNSTQRINDSFTISKEFLVSLLFTLHPIHSEAVCNIVGRAELLMAIFFLAAFDQFVNAVKCSIDKHLLKTDFFAYLLLAALSMFSKEQGIMVLPICVLFDWLVPLFSNVSKRATMHRSASILCALLFLPSLRMYINNFESPVFSKEDNPTAFLPTAHIRILNYLYIWLLNLWLLINPSKLCFDYSTGCIPIIKTVFEKTSFFCLLLVLFFSIVFSTCTFNFQWTKPKNRLYSFLTSFGLLAFLPSSNLLITVGFTVAERVLYLPSFPFIWLVLNLMEELIIQLDSKFFDPIGLPKNLRLKVFEATRNAYTIAYICIIVLMATKTFERSKEWNSEILLYSSGLTVCPNNSKIHYNIAKAMSNRGRMDDAQKSYLSTLKLNPYHELALNNLALILEKKGELEVAEALLIKALTIRPGFSTAWMNLGIVQIGQAKHVESEKSFLKALELRRDYSDCLFNLGNLYLKTNRSSDAQDCWVTATNIEPRHVPAWSNLFLLLEQKNDCEKVILLAEKALEWNPESAALYSQVGICLTKAIGSFEGFDYKSLKKAENFLIKATKIDPQNFLYWNNLGVFYHRSENFNLAQKAYKKALELDSTNKIVEQNLLKIRS